MAACVLKDLLASSVSVWMNLTFPQSTSKWFKKKKKNQKASSGTAGIFTNVMPLIIPVTAPYGFKCRHKQKLCCGVFRTCIWDRKVKMWSFLLHSALSPSVAQNHRIVKNFCEPKCGTGFFDFMSNLRGCLFFYFFYFFNQTRLNFEP